MPFDSRKQQQWYHATDQTYWDDKPHSYRKVKKGGSKSEEGEHVHEWDDYDDYQKCADCGEKRKKDIFEEGEEPEFKDLTTTAGGDLDPDNRNLQTTQGSMRESLKFEGKEYKLSPEGHVPEDDDLEYDDKIYTEVTQEEKEFKRGEQASEYSYKEMRESLLKNDVKQIIAKAVEEFKEDEHPRDGGKFTSKGGEPKHPDKPEGFTDKEFEKSKKEYEKGQKKTDPKTKTRRAKKFWKELSPSERGLFSIRRGLTLTEDEADKIKNTMDTDFDKLPSHYQRMFEDNADFYSKESKAKEEGMASVSGPPADSTMRVMSDKVYSRKDEESLTDTTLTDITLTDTVLGDTKANESLEFEGEVYTLSQRGYNPTDKDLIFEGKVYKAHEGIGNCQFCAGKGQITVENLGIKDCPDCDGTGEIQQPNPAPDITGQMDPSLQLGQEPQPTQEVPQQEPQPDQPTQQDQIPQQPMPNEQLAPPQQAPEENQFPPKEKPKFGEAKIKPIACEKSMKQFRGYIAREIEVLTKRAKANEAVSIMYGLPTISKQGKKIKGILAYAGVSLNDRIYLPEELSKGHGLTLPLLLNHSNIAGAEEELDRLDDDMISHLEDERDYKIGEVTLSWDQEKLTLFYEGVIEHEFFQKEVDDADMAVSLGIYYDSDSPVVCDENCYTIIKGAEFREVSLVYHPGFPIATIEAVENELKQKIMEKQKAKEDHLEKLEQLKKNEEEEQDKGEDEEKDIKLIDDVIKDVKATEETETDEETRAEGQAEQWDSETRWVKGQDEKWHEVDSSDRDYESGLSEKPNEADENEEDIIITDDPQTLDLVTQVPAEDWNEETIATESNFSIRGINGFTVSNSNGVTRYELDPSNGYENNWLHVNVNQTGAKLYGEEFQLQPKMTTPPELTKEIEKRPDIKFTEPDDDAFKKK